MSRLVAFSIAVTVFALVALLVAEYAGARSRIWVAKPLASTGFLVVAWGSGALESTYGELVLVALGLCWLGDVLLIAEAESAFLAGLGSFLLGHVAFGVAFAVRGTSWVVAAVAAALLAVPAVVVWRWLRPHLPPAMRVPVVAYTVVISLMVALAVGTFWQERAWLLLGGATAFFLSDLSVARDRFVSEAFVNRLWGLPTYYGAVLLLAASVTPGAP